MNVEIESRLLQEFQPLEKGILEDGILPFLAADADGEDGDDDGTDSGDADGTDDADGEDGDGDGEDGEDSDGEDADGDGEDNA